jgi:hypothetical protein
MRFGGVAQGDPAHWGGLRQLRAVEGGVPGPAGTTSPRGLQGLMEARAAAWGGRCCGRGACRTSPSTALDCPSPPQWAGSPCATPQKRIGFGNGRPRYPLPRCGGAVSKASRSWRNLAPPIGKPLCMAEKRRKTDRLNKYFRLKRIAAAQKNRRHAPPGRGPGHASAPLPGAGNAAQEPPAASSLQLLQASLKASKTSPERIN